MRMVRLPESVFLLVWHRGHGSYGFAVCFRQERHGHCQARRASSLKPRKESSSNFLRVLLSRLRDLLQHHQDLLQNLCIQFPPEELGACLLVQLLKQSYLARCCSLSPHCSLELSASFWHCARSRLAISFPIYQGCQDLCAHCARSCIRLRSIFGSTLPVEGKLRRLIEVILVDGLESTACHPGLEVIVIPGIVDGFLFCIIYLVSLPIELHGLVNLPLDLLEV
mmetsp:Transcript_13459/g.30525  ORF Transcript_13459/g.30525 Transcript_13459/m.30525 type:complete len:224 (-) Transcript_13459:105-776(-)